MPPKLSAASLLGIAFALAAGLLWGLVFIVPLMLPHQSPALLSVGRYLAFGVVCLAFSGFQWKSLRALSARDWQWALGLSVVGNFVYYGFLAYAIQTLGNPLPSVMIGTLPVVIALCANFGLAQGAAHRSVAWRGLIAPMGLLLAGLLCVNGQELTLLRSLTTQHYWLGILSAVLAVAAWAWYPLYNDKYLKQSPHIHASTWATAQGLATVLPAVVLFMLLLTWQAPEGQSALERLTDLPMRYWALMLTLGFAASWLGTLCWNAACQRLPAVVSGQLIVFETLAALTFGYAYREQWPTALSMLGIALLIAGVLLGVRHFSKTDRR